MTNTGAIPARSRLVVAILAAPVAGCVLGAILWGFGYIVFTGASSAGALLLLPFMGAAYGVSIGMIASLLFGLPIHILLVRTRLTFAWAYLASGAIFGSLTPFLVMLPIWMRGAEASYPLERAMHDAVSAVPLGAFLGFWVAAFFWLIRRPDRQVPTHERSDA